MCNVFGIVSNTHNRAIILGEFAHLALRSKYQAIGCLPRAVFHSMQQHFHGLSVFTKLTHAGSSPLTLTNTAGAANLNEVTDESRVSPFLTQPQDN